MKKGNVLLFPVIGIFLVILLASLATAAISPPTASVIVYGNKAVIDVVYEENVVLTNVSILNSQGISIPMQTGFSVPTSFSCGQGKNTYQFVQTFSGEGNFTFFIRVADCVNNFREDFKPFTILIGVPAGCGDRRLNSSIGEECDDGNNIDGDGCNARCQKEFCGNNRIDAGELCDANQTNGQTCEQLGKPSGVVKCDRTCKKFDTTGCTGTTGAAACGNGKIELGEECDGSVLGNIRTCSDFDSAFTGGTLRCNLGTCRFNTSACLGFTGGSCGDSKVGVGEECDGSVRKKCSDFDSFSGDGLVCTSKCIYDTSACKQATPFCGNSVIDPGEECDGKNWGPIVDCITFDPLFTGGVLSCSASTCRFNTSQCKGLTGGVCGDNQIAVGEECDGRARNACSDFDSFFGDGITCTDKCAYDTSLCQKPGSFCGDGEISTNIDETCDGELFLDTMQSCSDLTSFIGGTLQCTDCSVDTSLCSVAAVLNASCLDGKKDGSEIDVDCGGICSCCDVQKKCTSNANCCLGYCNGGVCAAPSCDDGVMNGIEPDVDCGGECAERCAEGAKCSTSSDCETLFCQDGLCVQPSCFDGISNGLEAGVDCGGNCADKCPLGDSCESSSDCESEMCEYGVCTVDKTLDSDADGMPDFWEEKYGLDKFDPSDAEKDPDKDGYDNLVEYNNGTDPLVFDPGGKNHAWNIVLLIVGSLMLLLTLRFLSYYRKSYLPRHGRASRRPSSPASIAGAYGQPQRGFSPRPQGGAYRPAPPRPSSKADMLKRLMEKRKGPQQAVQAPVKNISASASAQGQASSSAVKPVEQASQAKEAASSPKAEQGKAAPAVKSPGDALARLKSMVAGSGGAGKSSAESLKELSSKYGKKDAKKAKK